MPASEVLTATCPKCGAEVPRDPGWITWCECGWNLPGKERPAPKGRLARLYAKLGARHGARLFEEVRGDGAERPALTAAEVGLVALSAVAFALWLALPAGAVALAVSGRGPFRWPAVVLLALLGWVARPRAPRLEGVTEISPATHPRLTALVGDVARAVGADPPAGIFLHPGYGASVARVGPLRRPVLVLGSSLVAVLEPQQLVGVLAHEMGHFVNGDVAVSVVVGAAWETAAVLCDVLQPPDTDDDAWTVHRASTIVLWLAGIAPWLFLRGFVHLSFVTSQRAEYYADRLAAATGGSEEFARALERLLDGDLLEAAVHRVVVARSPRKPLDEFRDLLDSVPARERERRRRAAAEEASSIGFTHPPTGQRIRMIRERPPTAPAIALDRDGLDAIRAELRPEFDRANDRLADLYAAMLYR